MASFRYPRFLRGYGKTINNRYQIIKKLGEGGIGAVYLAEDKLYDNQKTALKTIRKTIARPDIIQRFKVEK